MKDDEEAPAALAQATKSKMVTTGMDEEVRRCTARLYGFVWLTPARRPAQSWSIATALAR